MAYFYLKFLEINHEISSFIAIISNILLMFLILTVKNSKLKSMAYSLMQNCILDLILSIVVLIDQPFNYFTNGTHYSVMGGPLYILGFTFSKIVIAIFAFSMNLSIAAMPIPFYFRYLVLCKNISYPKRQIIRAYIFALIPSLIVLVSALCVCFTQSYDTFIPPMRNKFWLSEYPSGATFCASDPANIRLIACFFMMFATTFVSYIFIIYYSIKITRHLNNAHISMSAKTKLLNKQFQRTLTVQAVVPFIIGNFPICLAIITTFLHYENIAVTLLISCFFGWIAVINPVAAIFIIAPYRTKLLSILHIKRNSVAPTNTTGTSGTNEPNKSNLATVSKLSVAEC